MSHHPILLLFSFAIQALLIASAVGQGQVPYAAIDGEPKLGIIKAYNADYALVVAICDEPMALPLGTRLAIRRDGVMVAFGYLEYVEEGTMVTLHLLQHDASAPLIARPQPGDDLIRYPRGYRPPE
ncbi:MAG: hypothetical protein AAGJ31_12725 [Verrucomicrobiota bacterium]